MSRCDTNSAGQVEEKIKTNKSPCCSHEEHPSANTNGNSGCCSSHNGEKIDWLLMTCAPAVVVGYFAYLLLSFFSPTHENDVPHTWWLTMIHTTYEMVNAMWWGVITASFFVGILGRIPRELIISLLGRGGSKIGILRATLAGLMLDLCNHGILMVGMKLYERGASIGQVMAFLIASPWNSLTLTLILIGLIGLPWTLLFILGSMVIAWVSGYIFDRLVDLGKLSANPNHVEYQKMPFWTTLKAAWKDEDWSFGAVLKMFWLGLKESKSVLRWVFFGIVLIALIRAFIPAESFSVWFGASASGLLLTLLAATVIEVCSEGSSPIAADLFNRAAAPGNAFTFLMAGAATDYTEIMAVQNTTRSWKIALALPIITVPQVLLIGWLMNVTTL